MDFIPTTHKNGISLAFVLRDTLSRRFGDVSLGTGLFYYCFDCGYIRVYRDCLWRDVCGPDLIFYFCRFVCSRLGISPIGDPLPLAGWLNNFLEKKISSVETEEIHLTNVRRIQFLERSSREVRGILWLHRHCWQLRFHYLQNDEVLAH